MMRWVVRLCVLIVAGVLCSPAQAAADAFVNPWTGVHFGNDDAASGLRSFGASVGEAGGSILGTETNISFAPGFFGGGVDTYELDLMAGITVGPTFNVSHKRLRPFVIGEVGMIRTSIDSSVVGGRFARTDFGATLGGGVTQELTDRLSFRMDLRYLRSFNSENEANSQNIDVGNLHFWRVAFGVVLH